MKQMQIVRLQIQWLLIAVGCLSNQSAWCQDDAAEKVGANQQTEIDYLSEIKPLLRDKCYACHSSLKQEGGLRLDAASLILKGGDSGVGLLAGVPDKSLILERVLEEDDDSRMPPAEAGARLSKKELAKLSGWIRAGAKAPAESIPEHPSRHWSFLPPVKTKAPGHPAKWIRTDIDRFLAAEQQKLGVEAVGDTKPELLLRRATLALTGLPPTPDELRNYLNDPSDSAYENAIDRLLESPRYGERWARHFMDIWRYSDPSGYGKEIRDGRQHIWRWRDWIVESLNSDKGYDRMIVEMLAADEYSPQDVDSLRATGFLARNWYKFNRNVWLDNIVEHSSKAFLGLTLNCARCHDHKYDPFDQQSYFRMRAIFETHDVRDETLHENSIRGKPGPGEMLVRAYDAHLDRQTFAFFQGDENRPDKDNPLPPGLPDLFGKLSVEPISLPATVWYPALQKRNRQLALEQARATLKSAETRIEQAQASVKAARKKLADFREPQMPADSTQKNTTKSASKNTVGRTILADNFSELSSDKWLVESGQWAAKNGRLVQSNGASQQHRLVSRINHPRDFRASLKLRITGGETYKSVGLGFDGNESAMNSVYLSVSGPKIQFSSQGSDGKWQYPASGAVSLPIQVGRDYTLQLVVKDLLLNVLLDGQMVLAYNLPQRKAGRLSLYAFSATAEFDELVVTTLTAQTQLVSVADAQQVKKGPVTRNDLQLALEVSQASEKVAFAQLRSAKSAILALEARIQSELVKHKLASGDPDSLASMAGRHSRDHELDLLAEKIMQARLKIAQARQKQSTGPPANRTKGTQELKAAEKQLAGLNKDFESAKKQLENGSAQYAALGPQYPSKSSGRRLAFAKWITDKKNPLTARVIVNHVWLRHFDRPLVERTFDFGLRSEKPRHAELLDWLAVRFMEDQWSLKKLHRRILTSGIYRRSSSPTHAPEKNNVADPDNLTLWRMNTRRMEAEVVRDSVLYLGKSLDLTTGGPPVDHTEGQKVLRRSLYFRQDKERQMTFLSLFDGAKVNECYERKSTVVPQQALAMFNSPIAAEQAKKIVRIYDHKKSGELVTALFEHILSRQPSAEEHTECHDYLLQFKDSATARSQLALVLLNHNDFVTIR